MRFIKRPPHPPQQQNSPALLNCHRQIKAEHEPVVVKAWNALAGCVNEDGILGYVQPVGSAPGESFANYKEVYAIGTFLAAGSEVHQMVGGETPSSK